MGWSEIYNIGAGTPAEDLWAVLLTTAIILAPLCLVIGLFVPRARSFLAGLFVLAMLGEGASAHLTRSALASGRADLAAGRFHQTEEAVQEIRRERLSGSRFIATTFRVQQIWFRLPEPVPEACAPRQGDVVRLRYGLVGEQVGRRIFANILSMETRSSACIGH